LQAARRAPQRPQASLLVAEDSITSRQLLKDILESAGYEVTTAPDGIAAFTSLQSGHYDLLVSDVEMPRLDGFGLTERVRRDKRLAELPVVLVTALDSRQDRERGVEAGANAYITKSGFDQRRLLDTIRALL
jgi:two-component system chemotaxis sensor kinase CheA